MKHRIHNILCLVFCLYLSMNAFADYYYDYVNYDAEIDGIYYSFYGNEATVEYQTCTLVIINYREHEIMDVWSDYSDDVVIPKTVIYNGKTYSVTSIGDYAFQNCSSLTSVTIPNSVTNIGNYAFYGCTSLTSITIPESVTSIGGYAFDSCTGLTSITIPENVTSIDENVFSYCSGLTSVTIPNSVTSIGNEAFRECSSLTTITIPNSVTSIGKRAFQRCSSLTSVTIPNSVTNIGEWAFAYCRSLTSITIPNSVTSIGDSAFSSCYFISNLFINYSLLTSSNNWGATLCDEETKDGLLLKGYSVVSCRPWVKSATIPYSVTNIGNYAFSGCTSLTSITIPNSVTSIGSSAFDSCTGLTSITIPESVTSIGGYAFDSCTGLTSITIPENVTSIDESVFYYCSGLTSVTIPNSVTSIGNEAFRECSSLTTITIPNSVTSIGKGAFLRCSSLTSVTLPNNVTSIDNDTFYGCSSLTSITIPNGVTNIFDYAFFGCANLTSVTIPNSVTSICCAAFGDCRSLSSVTIPNGVKNIGTYAFSSCSGLTTITIPESVTKIKGDAFSYCDALTSIKVENGNTIYNSRNNCNAIIETATNTLIIGCKKTSIPNSVTSIGSSAFRGCTGLTSVTIPNSVTSIDWGAFYGCSGLTSVTIPNNVTSIGDFAFCSCSSLTSVIIGDGVTSIGRSAFGGMSNRFPLIICNCVNPPEVNDDTFIKGSLAIVPDSLVDKYKSSYGWWNLIYNTGFRVVKTTQSTVTLVTPSLLSNQNVSLENYYHPGSSYYPVGDTLKITGLVPNRTYEISTHFEYGAKHYNGYLTITTLPVNVYLNKVESTNLTIKLKGSYDAGDADVTESGFEGGGKMDEYTFTGLNPDKSYLFTYYIICSDSIKFTKTELFRTTPIWLSASATPNATSCKLIGSCEVIDATVTDYGFVEYPKQSEVKLTGLDPETEYTKTFYVITQEIGKKTKDVSFTTKPLILTTQQPRVISDGSVIVAATSNLDDEETSVGFEWRRIDWTDDFDSKIGNAYLYDGMMEGYIRSINSNYLWKFRPFYTSNSGYTYYGEWKGMDPSDYSYFEPTVYTYATINLTSTDTGVNAEIKGYAMRGTDRITSQGFMYWKSSAAASSRMKAASIPSGAKVVEANGNVMTAVLEDLDYDTQYCYVAFVKTEENESFFGEVQTFYMDTPDGIENMRSVEVATEVARYNIQGRKLNKPQKGINIIRYSDGTTRKVLVK